MFLLHLLNWIFSYCGNGEKVEHETFLLAVRLGTSVLRYKLSIYCVFLNMKNILRILSSTEEYL